MEERLVKESDNVRLWQMRIKTAMEQVGHTVSIIFNHSTHKPDALKVDFQQTQNQTTWRALSR